MGWAFCGQDDLGRDIGYGVDAVCDFEGCEAKIDRGLGYICGSMHNGDNDDGCGRYFCGEHEYEAENGHKCEERAVWLTTHAEPNCENCEKPITKLRQCDDCGQWCCELCWGLPDGDLCVCCGDDGSDNFEHEAKSNG